MTLLWSNTLLRLLEHLTDGVIEQYLYREMQFQLQRESTGGISGEGDEVRRVGRFCLFAGFRLLEFNREQWLHRAARQVIEKAAHVDVCCAWIKLCALTGQHYSYSLQEWSEWHTHTCTLKVTPSGINAVFWALDWRTLVHNKTTRLYLCTVRPHPTRVSGSNCVVEL